MSTRRSMHIIMGIFAKPWLRGILLILYYLAILVGLIMMYGKGNFSVPAFIYQGF
jgi:hypothetical protein